VSQLHEIDAMLESSNSSLQDYDLFPLPHERRTPLVVRALNNLELLLMNNEREDYCCYKISLSL